MVSFFAKRGGRFKTGFFLLPLVFFGLTFFGIGSRAGAEPHPGDYYIQVTLTNPRDDVKIVATRHSNLGPQTVNFTGSGTTYKTDTIEYTDYSSLCRDYTEFCRWTITVTDKSNAVIGSVNSVYIISDSVLVGEMGKPVPNISVPAQGSSSTSTGGATGKAQFKDYNQNNTLKNAPPATVQIIFSLNDKACAANPKNDPVKGCYVTSPETNADGSPKGTYTILGMIPGTYSARMVGGYVNPSGSGNVSIDEKKTGVVVKGGAPTTVDFVFTAPGSEPKTTCDDGSTPNAQGECPEDGDQLDCGNEAFNWLACPLITIGVRSIQILDSFIMNTLNVDVRPIFDGTADKTSASYGYYTAWSSFRVIAILFLIIAGLIMVISQALGFEALDAYTIRKTLPRILIAIIGISLSWALMRLVVSFFDTAGVDIRELMYAPFKNFHGSINPFTGVLTTILGVGIWVAMGPAALTFVLTAALAILVGYLTLVVRQIAIVMLIIVAPVAIACYVLPNTQRVWNLWRETFLGLMLMFPIVSALIAAGHIFSVVAISTGSGVASLTTHAFGAVGDITGHSFISTFGADVANNIGSLAAQGLAIIAYFMPYFMIPQAAKWSNSLLGAAAGIFNNATAGARGALAKVRGNAAARRHQERANGQMGFFGTGRGSNFYRRMSSLGTPNSGAWGLTRNQRAAYQDFDTRRRRAAAAEGLKHDDGRGANDDLGNEVAQVATGRDDFIQRHMALNMQRNGVGQAQAEQAARESLAQLENGYRARMGSRLMSSTAWQAQALSVTGVGDTDADKARFIEATRAQVRAGNMTAADAMATLKGNKARVDLSGWSFGTGAGVFGDINGPALVDNAGNMTAAGSATVQTLMDTALEGLTPGSTIGMRREAMTSVGRHLTRQLEQVVQQNNGDITAEPVVRVMAQIAGLQDVINSQSPQLAREYADTVLAQTVLQRPRINANTGQPFLDLQGNVIMEDVRVRDYSDELRAEQNVMFNDVRKEWLGGGNGGQQQYQQGQQQQQQNQNQGNSDRRLKRGIVALGTTPDGIQLYRFKYLWSNQEYVGVMAQDLLDTHPEALSVDPLGYYRVNYTMLGLRMMTIEEWEAEHARITIGF